MNNTPVPSRSTSASRRRLWATLAVAALLIGGLGFTHCVWRQHNSVQQHVASFEREAAFNRQLDQFVKLNFGRPVLLKAWLEEWSRQTGIPIEVCHSALVPSADVAAEEISLDLPLIPARHALDSLGQRYGTAWEQQEHERIILHWYRRDALEMQHEIVTFPGPDFLAVNYPT